MTDLRAGAPPVIAVFGPTASGKTAVAEALADRVGGTVISCDSMQVYRGLPVLTNQPSRPTQGVAIWGLDHEASVGEYQALAHALIDAACAAGSTPVLAGGTGLWLRAALSTLDVPPPAEPGVRPRLEALYDREGAAAAHRLLAERDPRAAEVVHPNDRRRVVRALELAESGRSLRPAENRLWTDDLRLPTVIAGLELDPSVLETRIRARAEAMLAAGAAGEARRALAGPLSRTAAQVIGLRELVELPAADALEAIVVRTRQYAAYQRKWMRRMPGLVPIAADRSPDEVVDAILEVAGGGQRLPGR